jgi:hypothetical protein
VKKPIFVLDSYALLAHFQGEPQAIRVKEILRRARDKDAVVFLGIITPSPKIRANILSIMG